jgi:hypothetical protein
MLTVNDSGMVHTLCGGHAYVVSDTIVCGKCHHTLYVEVPFDTDPNFVDIGLEDIYGDQLTLDI